jgi:sodium transport system permease protein
MGSTAAYFRKELREISRDRKVIFLSILLPVLIYPVLLSLMNAVEEREEERARTQVLAVAVTGPGEIFREAIAKDSTLALREDVAEPDLEAAVRNGEIQVWLDAPTGIAPTGGETPAVRLVYHGPHEESEEARERVLALLERVRAEESERRAAQAGLARPLAEILTVEEEDVATAEESGGAKAGRLVPFILIVSLFIGGGSLATDIVAGEKERGTLETLYLTPAPRARIALAKFLVVMTAIVTTGVLNLASMIFCYQAGWVSTPGTAGGLVLSSGGIALTVLLVVPLAALLGGILLAISAHARSLKEAQYLMLPVMLLAFLPGMLTMSQDIRLGPITALIPLANVALAIRDGLLGAISPLFLALVVVASCLWGLLAIRGAARMLSREESILGLDPEPLFARTQAGRRRAALLGMALTVLLFSYVGTLIQTWNLEIGLALSLWVLLPLLAAGVLRFAWSGGRLRDVLSLHAPRPRFVLAGILLGIGVIVPVVAGLVHLQSLVFPTPEGFLDELTEGAAAKSFWLLLLLMAVSPGVCEELVFRGAFLGLLRRVTSTRAALLYSAVFFALVHLSVFRFLPTFVLGLLLGALTVASGSLLPAVVLHAVYNGAMFAIERFGWELGDAYAWIGSLLLLAAGWSLVRGSVTRER